jgi:hypothetical protein
MTTIDIDAMFPYTKLKQGTKSVKRLVSLMALNHGRNPLNVVLLFFLLHTLRFYKGGTLHNFKPYNLGGQHHKPKLQGEGIPRHPFTKINVAKQKIQSKSLRL